MSEPIATGSHDAATDLLTWQSTREGIDGLVQTWNENKVRNHAGYLIRMSYREWAPGRIELSFELISDHETEATAELRRGMLPR